MIFPSKSTPYFLAEHNSSDDIFRSNTVNFSRSAVFTNIIGGFNAGGGDLAAIVTPNEAEPIPESSNVLGLFLVAGVSIFTGIKFKKKADLKIKEEPQS